MPDSLPSPRRRRLMGLLMSLPFAGRAAVARAAEPVAPPPVQTAGTARMLVPGPEGGPLDRWARVLHPALAQCLPPGLNLQQTDIGGADGVTAANRFETRGTPDGLTVLMTPGDAVLAWLMGDPRAKFDVSRWVAVMAAVSPSVLAGRPGLLGAARPVRIAANAAPGPEVAALLAVELLGIRAEPVACGTEPDAMRAAFARNVIDAALLRGHNVAGQLQSFAGLGGQPLFALAAPDAGAADADRAPPLPEMPTLAEVYRRLRGAAPAGALFDACMAASVAAQMEFGLMLPQLTPASMVAVWRKAGTDAAANLEVQAISRPSGLSLLGGTDVADRTAPMAPDAAALLALRTWLTDRFHWRPA